MLDYLSSPMRWCESLDGNIFIYSNYIVEFWNSLTSLSFCIFAIYGWYNHKELQLDNIPWIFLFIIGITSTWFHVSLSLMGQFCDELSIILLISYCLRIFFKVNKLIYYFLTILSIGISLIYPSVSPPILLTIGLLLVPLTHNIIVDDDTKYLWDRGIIIGGVSILTWIFDFVCYFNTHMYWHILISMSAYYMILLIIRPECKVSLYRSIIPRWYN
jgi:hypothetical protein